MLREAEEHPLLTIERLLITTIEVSLPTEMFNSQVEEPQQTIELLLDEAHRPLTELPQSEELQL